MNIYLSVALGGAIGACARYGVGQLALKNLGAGYPFGTLFVNVTGSFLMGLLIEALALRISLSPALQALLVTGFLGGYTTFSAFSLDAALMIERGEMLPAALYVLLSVGLSIAGLFAGLYLMKMVIS